MTELICRLDRNRFSVSVACFGYHGALLSRLHAADIPITEFRLHGLASTGTARQLLRFARWCQGRQIRIVHACDFYANVFALPAAALAGVPVRIGSRRDVSIPERTANQHRLQRFAYRFAHRIVANSTAAADQLMREGVPAGKIVRIANGLDLTRFPLATPLAGRQTVTTVANLRPGKGHDVLLDAAARIVRRQPGVRFQIVGDGPRREALVARAAMLGLSANVRFMGHCDNIPQLLSESDVFAFPSFMEASPNSVLEAMAAGLPIVATRAGGIPEVVHDERTGLLVPPGNADAMASAILRLLEDPALAARLGASAHQSVESRFTFELMTSEFQSIFLDQLAARGGDTLAWASPSGT